MSSMTDISELAQKGNAAISLLSSTFEPGHINQREVDALSYAVDVMNELVEALEKAQTKNALVAGGIEASTKLHERIAELDAELEREREKSRRVMSRIAELESRTITSEKLQESAYRAGLTAGWNLGLTNNNDGFNKCLAAHTAGIKWEAE